MSDALVVPLLSLAVFLGMLTCLELGYRISSRAVPTEGDIHEGLGTIEAAIFALLGLLLGFAFSGATSRLDMRRELIVEEANAIGTAYLRLDLLPSSAQPDLRRLFREYLEARLRAYHEDSDRGTRERLLAAVPKLQQQIWTQAVVATGAAASPAVASNTLLAINEMIDVSTARTVARQTRLPTLILVLLIVIALTSALVAGYAKAQRGRRSPLHAVLYAAAVAVTIYVVLDLDNPRIGLIRLDATEQILQDLHDSIR